MKGYQLKITIKYSSPPIWRKVIVPEHISFRDLDDVIEMLFGWMHDHMYEFTFPDEDMRFTGEPIPGEEDNTEESVDLWLYEGRKFNYIYDFGDWWEHTIVVEKIVDYDKRYPTVLKFKGSNMIEDCGGIMGYYEEIDEAEPFDMEKINQQFSFWNFSECLPMEAEDDDMDEDFFEDDFPTYQEMFKENLQNGIIEMLEDYFHMGDEEKESFRRSLFLEQTMRDVLPEAETLKEAYLYCSKEDLKDIARFNGFRGYSKLNKAELVNWLVPKVLDKEIMEKVLLESEKFEIDFFEQCIHLNGSIADGEIYWLSKLLFFYGKYDERTQFLQIPKDAQQLYQEVMTEDFRQTLDKNWNKIRYCEAAVYLYGSVSIKELQELYYRYEQEEWEKEDIRKTIQDLVGEEYCFLNGRLMEERLAEEQNYAVLAENQKKYERYYPLTKEEFLKYSDNFQEEAEEECDNFCDYLVETYKISFSESVDIYDDILDVCRMNMPESICVEYLIDSGLDIKTIKQKKDMEKLLKKIFRNVRKWDLNGHCIREIAVEPVPASKDKVYPNDMCPCGSGKKYKHCCGKKS